MNLADLPPVPPKLSIQIEHTPDGVTIVLPRRWDITVGLDLLIGGVVLALFTGFQLYRLADHGRRQDSFRATAPPNMGRSIAPWVLLLVGSAILVRGIVRSRKLMRSGLIRIDPERLLIDDRGLILQRRHAWKQAQISGIAAWQGLRVRLSDGSQITLLPDRDPGELRYVVAVARQSLHIPQEHASDPVDLIVTYRGTFWDDPEDGLLHVEPGRLTLAHPQARKPHLKFVSGDGLIWHWLASQTMILSPNDVVCRLEEEGNCRLEIAPVNVLGGKGPRGKPRIDIAPLGRVFTLSMDLEECHATRLPSKREEFRLTLRCDDPEALPLAVARFWGNREG